MSRLLLSVAPVVGSNSAHSLPEHAARNRTLWVPSADTACAYNVDMIRESARAKISCRRACCSGPVSTGADRPALLPDAGGGRRA